MPKDLQKALAEWQEALRLQDWDITAEMLRPAEYEHLVEKKDSYGCNNIDWPRRKCQIFIRDDPGVVDELEFTLVHELVHILIDRLDTVASVAISFVSDKVNESTLEGLRGYELETSVNMITRALLKVRDMAQEVREK